MTLFEFQHPVLFQHCDPAGIVFYPRYFEMVNACVETWFDQEIGVSFNQMHLQLGLSVPTVLTETKFHAPSHLGDHLIFQLKIAKLGSSSLLLQITVLCEAQIRLTNETTVVLVDQQSGRPTRWSQHAQFNTLTHTHS